MKIAKLKLRDSIVDIKLSDKTPLHVLVRKYLNRVGKLSEFIEDNDPNAEKCRICKKEFPPVDIVCHVDDNSMIVIDEFIPRKTRIYCYAGNKDCDGIRMNSNSVEFISKVLLISEEEALSYIKKNNKSTFYKENWENVEDYIQSQRRDEDYFKNKYKDNWEIEYENYKSRISYSNSKERYISEFGEDGAAIFDSISKQKDNMSFSFFLKKNNQNYEKALFEYNNKKESVSLSIDAYIRRHGEQEGPIKYKEDAIKKRDGTRRYFNSLTDEEKKQKHGITIEKIGEERYYDWLIKTSVGRLRSSKEASVLFNEVLSNFDFEYDDIFIGLDDRNEFYIRDNNGKQKIYFYDFTIRSKKLIIEYNGIVFHPKLENMHSFKPIKTNLSTGELFEKQKYKVELAKSKGFKVLEVWSDDEEKLEKCINFIKNNI